jgi:hypothetical protein
VRTMVKMISGICLLLLLSAGCGNNTNSVEARLATDPPAQQGFDRVLPPVSDLPQTLAKSAASMQLLRLGSEYNTALANNRVLAQAGNQLLFNPNYTHGGAFDNLSYAIYDFNTSGYSSELGFHLTWQLAPPAGDPWLGLANYARGRWDWFQIPDGGNLQLGAFSSNYQNPGGTTYAAIVLAGVEPAVLERIRLGVNVLPQAVLLASSTNVQIGSTVDFDATGSSDPDGAIIKYEFDPMGDGGFTDNGLNPLTSYKYDAVGDYPATLRVTDSDGATATQSINISVTTDASGWVHNLKSSLKGSTIRAWDSLVDPQGNVYLCGEGHNLISALSLRDGFVAKYSSTGQMLWSFTYADDYRQNVTEVFSALALDSQGGLFVAGCNQQGDSWVMLNLFKLNASTGEVIWAKEMLGLFMGEFGYNAKMAVDGSDHLLLAIGEINSSNSTNQLFIVRYTTDGQIDWSRHWETVDPVVLSGLAVDNSNNIYLTGTHDPYLILNAFICSLDATGSMRWAKSFDAGTTEAFSGVTVNGGNVYCVGRMDVAGEGARGAVLKLTTAGEAVWCASYDNAAGANADNLFAAVPSAGGGIYISGTTVDAGGATEALMLALDASGALLWQRGYGTSAAVDSANARFARGSDGALYFCGNVAAFSSAFGALSGTMQLLTSGTYTLTDITDPLLDYSDTDFFVNPTYSAWANVVEDAGGAFVMRYYE